MINVSTPSILPSSSYPQAPAVYGQNGINICVLSRDSDFMQLMDNRSVHLLYVKSGKKDVVGPIKFDVTATGDNV